jgi:acid stress-induced BolA-like protein IbaG/YrbA
MMPEQIAELIEAGIPGCTATVEGDGTHFSAVVISEEFAGKSPVQQHQIVYRALGGRVGTEIHALSMQTYTPEQWERRRRPGTA